MSIIEIKKQITLLPPADLADLAKWWEEWQADEWDKQIERDILAGRFDGAVERINRQREAGEVHPVGPGGLLVPDSK